MKINKNNPKHWYYLGLQALFTMVVIALRPLLRKGKPHIVVLYGHQIAGHLAAIYDQWDTTRPPDMDCYFLSLNPDPILVGRTVDPNILYCHRLRDMLVVARASAMVTDHGLHMMAPLVRLTDIKFFDVGHGIPFKGYDEEDFRLQAYYTEVWTSSEALSDLYAKKCGCEGLVYSLGAPRTDKLINSTENDLLFRKFAGIPSQAPVILYAPTWQQDDRGRALVPFGQDEDDFLGAVSAFCKKEDAFFIFRCHQNAAFSEHTFDRIIYCPQRDYPDTENILLAADVLISDWSSIVFDFIVLDRPTIFLDVPHPFAKGCTLGPEFRFGHIARNMNDLLDALQTYVERPEVYFERHYDRHRSVKLLVYDNNADGAAAERCLHRIEFLLL